MSNARNAAITDFDSIKPDRRCVDNVGDDGSNDSGVRYNQTMLPSVMRNGFIISGRDTLDETIKRFGALWAVTDGVLQERSIFQFLFHHDSGLPTRQNRLL